MLDTLLIGTSGLLANAQGLKIVSNNLANVNTPGFKGSQLQFSNLFEQGTHGGQAQFRNAGGMGVETLGAALNFKSGADQTTGNTMDQSINGNGMFTVAREGELFYTRAGDFQFNSDNVLVNSAGDHVQALANGGGLEDITLTGLERSLPKATSKVIITGNLTSTVADPVVDAKLNAVTIIDPEGGTHTVNLVFKNNGDGSFAVIITDGIVGGADVGSGTLQFTGGSPVEGAGAITFQYANAKVPPFDVVLDFSEHANALPSATTLAMLSQDGHVAGVRTDQVIGADGTVTVHYSNGQTVKGPRLALAQFGTTSDLVAVSGGAFSSVDGAQVTYGYANSESFGGLLAGHREGSNVDLAEEFSNLILMQRGYQASSHVVSTANDMIQELFDMKGHR
jgi:flagellar hook protein FlgE